MKRPHLLLAQIQEPLEAQAVQGLPAAAQVPHLALQEAPAAQRPTPPPAVQQVALRVAPPVLAREPLVVAQEVPEIPLPRPAARPRLHQPLPQEAQAQTRPLPRAAAAPASDNT